MSLIFLFIMWALTILLAKIDYRNNKVLYTPFILFSIPYMIVMTFQVLFIYVYEATEISWQYVLYVIEHFVVIFIVDLIFYVIFRSSEQSKLLVSGKEKAINEKVASVISFFGIISSIYLLAFFVINMLSLDEIGKIVQETFQERYTGGANFYFRLLAMIATIYFLATVNVNKKRNLLYALFCLLPNVLTFVKGIILINIIAGILANIIYNNRKIKIKDVLRLGISGVAIFFIVYMVEIGIWEPKKLLDIETYKFIFTKFIVYFVAGVQGFNEAIVNGGVELVEGSMKIFTPFVNFAAKFFSVEKFSIISEDFVKLGYIEGYGEIRSNVFSYVGEAVIYCGNGISILVGVANATLLAYLFNKMRKMPSFLNCITYALFASSYVLAWFSYYLGHSFFYYILIMMFIIWIVASLVIERGRRNAK